MTTPHGLAPEGAFVFGGGSYRYGQEYSENAVSEMFSVRQATNPAEALSVLGDVLDMAPQGTINGLQQLLPGRDEDDFEQPDVTSQTFMEALEEKNNPFQWIADLRDAITSGFGGDSGSTSDPVWLVLSQAKREMSRMQAGIAALQADATANGNSGRTFQVAVSEYSGVPGVFTSAYNIGTGSVTNDGDTLEISNNDLLVMYRYNLSDLLTDYFETSVVVPRQSKTYFGGYGNRSVFLVGRADLAWQSLCMARLNGTTLSVGCVNGGLDTGTYTWFGSGSAGSGPTTVNIPVGDYMTFRGGTLNGDRVFQFLVSNEVVATFVDTGSVSQMGPLNRWTGFGIWNDADDSINRAPNVSHFLANDNQPAPVEGSGARISRINTVGVAMSSTTKVAIPSGFFDTEDEKSGDIEVDAATGSFTVTEGDFYTLTLRMKAGGAFPNHMQLVLIKNGLPDMLFGPDFGFVTTFGGSTDVPLSISASVTVPLHALDTVQAGYFVESGTGQFRGDPTGFETYLTISRGRK